MRAKTQSSAVSLFASCLLLASVWRASAQSPLAGDTGVVSDDDLTLVVGTRFVAPPPADDLSAKALFDTARIPLASFNDTDSCVDQTALEVAQEYFAGLGRVMGKAGHFYFVPDDEIKKAVAMCERMHGRPPQAWVDTKTKVVAFGRVVPTTHAAALEQTIR